MGSHVYGDQLNKGLALAGLRLFRILAEAEELAQQRRDAQRPEYITKHGSVWLKDKLARVVVDMSSSTFDLYEEYTAAWTLDHSFTPDGAGLIGAALGGYGREYLENR